MKNILAHMLILLAGTLLVACSHTPDSVEWEELTTVDAILQVERSGKIAGEWHSDEILPYFGVIPGSIFGSPLENIVLPAKVSDESRLTVELSDWNAMAESEAEPLSEMNIELGLRIQPTDTRLLRISTFAYDIRHDQGMDGGLKEVGGNEYMILVYSDRACVISGKLVLGKDEYTHSINLPSKGFHYILVDDNKHLTRQRVQKELLFVTNH